MRRRSLLGVPMVAFLLSSGPLSAQDTGPRLIPETADGVVDDSATGWHPWLRFGANMALGQSKNVPGTADGLSLQLGYKIGARLDFLSQKRTNEWTNFLGMELAYTRTPVVDAFVKSIDKIEFKSTYLYHPEKLPWLGPFVAFRLSTPMLPGYDVRSDPSNVVHLEPKEAQLFNDAGEPIDDDGQVIDANHDSVTQVNSGDRIDLTEALSPLTIRESVGVFAIPLDKPWLKTDFRLGFGAWETFVRDGYVIEDNPDTADLLELRRMQDSVQLGPELGIALGGAYKEHLTYAASALFMQPVYQTTETDLEGIELLNMEFEAGLGVRITKYFSIDYSFKAYKQPLIVDDWQIQNNILLTIAFEVPAPATPPPVCPPAPECPSPAPASEATSPDAVLGSTAENEAAGTPTTEDAQGDSGTADSAESGTMDETETVLPDTAPMEAEKPAAGEASEASLPSSETGTSPSPPEESSDLGDNE